MQLTDWPIRLIEERAKDYQVIIFDNRDVGLSSKINDCKKFHDLDRNVGFFDQEINYASYTLYDMANDALNLIDALGVEQFHLLGFSMGGMIAQIIAATNPNRVSSLVCISSSGGEQEIRPSNDAKFAMEQAGKNFSPELAIKHLLDANCIYAGPKYPFDISTHTLAVTKNVKRQYYPEGVYRQGLAMRASGNREGLLKEITAPTLIIHGTHDPCIPLSQAIHASELITSSKLCVIAEHGHDFPEQLLPYFAKTIKSHCERLKVAI